jgi:hypothetical protein
MSMYDDTKDDENPAYALRGHNYYQCCLSPKEVGHKFTCVNHPRMKDNTLSQIHVSKITEETPDPINHPKHYVTDKVEVIDVIEAFDLDFYLGSVLKYVLRHNRKGKPLEDLRKAAWFLARKIKNLEEKATKTPINPLPPAA